MKFIEFNSEPQNSSTRVGIIASHEVTQQIRAALPDAVRAEVNHLPWPVVDSLKPSSITYDSPDLVVCEINDPTQAVAYRQEIGFLWPEATLISCETDIGVGTIRDSNALEEASRQAGYQGHLIIHDVALQLPVFLRYAEQRRVADQQAHQLLQLKKLLEASHRMHSSIDQQHVAGEILNEFRQWVIADSWQLYVVSDDGRFMELIGSEGIRTKPPSLTLRANGEGVVERVLQQGEMVVLSQAELASGSAGEREMREHDGQAKAVSSVLCFPLKVGSSVIGVTQAMRIDNSQAFSVGEQESIKQVASMAALALNNATKFARAEKLYMQDDLTQLHNSRYLRQYLETELRRTRRYGGQVAVIFIDLDGFKAVNDQYGHRVGSETLKEMASLLMESVRDTDVVTRYGGDEFTIVLPETDAHKAFITADRVRQKVAAHNFHGGSQHTFHLTASFGIASYPECSAESAADLLEQADLAMYAAKAANKNNVQLAKSEVSLK
ncbi:MAG: diguanylate cyclase [Acidobacteria bacterium]|nr:diguanylate cyclase [Acidobacteriota bacterium]